MKGIAIPVSAIIMIVIMIGVLYFIHTQGWTENSFVTFRGEVAMSASHEAELTRKMLDQGSYFIAQKAAYDLARVGGKDSVWVEAPTINDIREDLVNKIEGIMPSGVQDASYEKRQIRWIDSNVLIDENQNPCDGSTCFYVGGSRTFRIEDQNIGLEITSNASFDQYVDSNYFDLARAAILIFNSNWYTEDESVIETNMQAAYDYNVDKTVDGNIITISVYDDTCLPQIHCIAPVEVDGTTITLSSGEDVPFDYIRFNFTVES